MRSCFHKCYLDLPHSQPFVSTELSQLYQNKAPASYSRTGIPTWHPTSCCRTAVEGSGANPVRGKCTHYVIIHRDRMRVSIAIKGDPRKIEAWRPTAIIGLGVLWGRPARRRFDANRLHLQQRCLTQEDGMVVRQKQTKKQNSLDSQLRG